MLNQVETLEKKRRFQFFSGRLLVVVTLGRVVAKKGGLMLMMPNNTLEIYFILSFIFTVVYF